MKWRGSFTEFTWGICLITVVFISNNVISPANSLRTKPKGSRVSVTSSQDSKSHSQLGKSNSTKIISSGHHGLTARILQAVDSNSPNEFSVISSQIDSDVIVGRDLVNGARIILECSAPYPVQWIYSGDGV
jgi:hypothetical protein